VLFSNIGLYEHLLQWAFYAEERRKSREDVDVFISLLLSTGGTLTARQDVSRVGTRNHTINTIDRRNRREQRQ
jgi:hypothetical protein